MPLYELGADRMAEIAKTTFEDANVRERTDLQRLLRDQIEILVPDGMVLAEEFSNWDDSSRRIDLLVLDNAANLVVLELKRTGDGGHMELQAIRYAAMVSAMTFQQAVHAHAQYLLKSGSDEDAEARILGFLGWPEPDEDAFGQDVRIVLASADFGKELTTPVLWLNERGMDIRCARMVPYEYEGKTLVHVEHVIPLPEAEEYQVRVREKTTQERVARSEQAPRAQRNLKFWSGLLQKASAELPLHQNVSPSKDNWLAASRRGILFMYVTARGRGRVELCIERPSKAENKAIFDDLKSHQSEIEAAFGGRFTWRRIDNGMSSRISAEVDGGSVLDEATWVSLQCAMVAAMKRMEAALRPYVERYCLGASPDMPEGADEASPA